MRELGPEPGAPEIKGPEAEGLERMVPLVRLLALRIHAGLPPGSGIEVSDLVQAGNLGLIQAVRTFKENCGTRLPGYAKYRIRGEMLDTVRRHAGRGDARRCMVASVGADGEQTIEERVSAPAETSPHRQLATLQRATILRQEVARLPDRDRTVLRLRYSRGCSLKDIGAFLDVKESRACQLHASAIGRLRRALGRRGVNALWHLL
jgi:RNA polymerase sigma factor for flagellar operon FliA